MVRDQGNRLYFHYSSYDEDGVVNTHEFREIALAAYEQAIQLAPHEAILYYHKGQLLEQLDRPTEAVAAFAEAGRLGYQRPMGMVDGRDGRAGRAGRAGADFRPISTAGWG